MAEEKGPGRVGIAAAFAALALVLVLSVWNIARGSEPFLRFFRGEAGFKQVTQQVASAYTSEEFRPREACVTLSGLFARASGRRIFNNAVLMGNGMLTVKNDTGKMPLAEARKTAAFAGFLEDLGIPFLCVLAPYKVPLEGSLLPAGAEDISNAQRDVFAEKLREAGVPVLDLRAYYSASPEQVTANFYRTDHHWTPDTALQAFCLLTGRLEGLLQVPLDRRCADPAQWERHTLEDWWLGSSGKRVGPLFAGTDPLIWYTPKFETELSYAFVRTNQAYGFRKGDYESICLFTDAYTKQRDFFGMDGEGVCMDKLYPLVVHRNLKAPNPQRILLIGDSFSRGIQTWLASEFAEVHLLDPRYYTASSLAQYAEWNRPDAVLVLSQTLSGTFFVNSGAADQTAWREAHPRQETLLSGMSLAAESPVTVRRGQVYRLSFDSVSFPGTAPEAVSALVLDPAAGEILQAMVFDPAAGGTEKAFRWAFRIPEDRNRAEGASDEIILLLRAGLPEEPGGGAEFTGVTLSRDAE